MKKMCHNNKELTYCVLLSCIVSILLILPVSLDASEKEQEIKFGIVSFYNPRLMVMRYQPLLDALSKRTPFSYKLILTRSYSETVDKLENGEIDIAYLGPVTYVRAQNKFKTEPLVRLNTNKSDVFYSVIAVRDDSDIKELKDLKNKHFAFGSPLSTSSHLFPRMMLKEEGILPDQLASFHYYKHHDSAARAVLKGEADACGIRDVVAERYEKKGLRVIIRSEPIPNFPLVVRATMDEDTKHILKTALLSLKPESQNDAVEMSGWDKEIKSGFSDVSSKDYEKIRELMMEYFGENALAGDPSIKLNDRRIK